MRAEQRELFSLMLEYTWKRLLFLSDRFLSGGRLEDLSGYGSAMLFSIDYPDVESVSNLLFSIL